ncbi:MAG: hypothetical protein CVU39_14145 [Chloroflexi bacterium HGW-Chloroflexi-10]|nr:MAG: hypothetical protein CVU39_14145 [Chloroflexi bacterium HGW-Chloroflexi-10]
MAGSKVALVYCNSYELKSVKEAVRHGLTLLGGVEMFAKAGEKILVKPNMLVGASPDHCVGPHPIVFQAILEQFLAAGVQLSFGDSPGFGSPRMVARQAGLLAVADALGVPLADFQNGETVSFLAGRFMKQFNIARGIMEADGLVSLSKMKSHALTRITGAIKNQFGCIPGVLKAEFHSRLPDANQFSKMLVDLNLFLKPRLYIMDGVIAMEGNGPRNGTPRKMNVLLFSTDPVALDATVCRMIHLDENLVEPIVHGNVFGLGSSEKTIYLGEPVERFDTPDFIVNRVKGSTSTRIGLLTNRFMRNYITPRPMIMEEKCTQCGQCVMVCPAEPKALIWKNGKKQPPIYHYADCIRCYCCQELCPHEAISVRIPLLGRLIHRS